jgi:hypothetical protein
VLRDVAHHDPASNPQLRPAWVDRLRKFGIPIEERTVVLPEPEVGVITPLADWTESPNRQ